jgi:hypothetical protein
MKTLYTIISTNSEIYYSILTNIETMGNTIVSLREEFT